jgi:KDO2-lipid IV(A) lauroyltransferase
VCIFARAGLAIIPFFSPAAASAVARACGSILYFTCRRRKRIVFRNLDIAFGPGNKAQRKRIARKAFQHAAACLASLAARDKWSKARDFGGSFQVDPAAARLLEGPQPRGIAILSAHVGDWEALQWYLSTHRILSAVVTREISNPHLDRQLRRLRLGTGARLIPKQGALRELRAAIDRGEGVGLMADQNCPKRSRFFDFFGVPASTYTGYSRVLARAGVRVVFAVCLRDSGDFRFRIQAVLLQPEREPSPGAAPPSAGETKACADGIVSRYLKAMEDVVREHPEQYLWLHRRWKSRPTGSPWLYGELGRPLDPDVRKRSFSHFFSRPERAK